jgi:DNA-binding Lrp family transcriptional regulator
MKTNIDEIDATIIKRMLIDSRTSFTDLAKECKLTPVAVRMRYKRLWKTGIINGETMLINPFSLGYKYVGLIQIITNKENREKAEKLLNLKLKKAVIGQGFGRYSLWVQAPFYNLTEIAKLQRALEEIPLVKSTDVLILSEDLVREHPENLSIIPFEGKKIDYIPALLSRTEILMDETDREIARILLKKSRISFRKVAKQLGISTKNVIERYKRLKGTVFMLATITVDLRKLGYDAGAYFKIKLTNRSKIAEVEAQLLKTPNLIAVIKYVGAYDIFAHLVIGDLQEYFRALYYINGIQNVEWIEVYIVPPFSSWPLNLFARLL